MHPITLLMVFLMVGIQAAVWIIPMSGIGSEDLDLPLENYFKFTYSLGTQDVAWNDVFNIESKSLKVATDRTNYQAEDIIRVSGTVKPVIEGKQVTIAVTDQLDQIVSLDYITPNNDGGFVAKIPADELVQDDSYFYKVWVISDLDKSTSSFSIENQHNLEKTDVSISQILD